MVGYEILFWIMLKFQRQNYPCLLEKTIFNYEMRQLRLKSSDVPLDEFWICIEGVYKRISKVSFEILQFCTTCCTCVNKVSHFCY